MARLVGHPAHGNRLTRVESAPSPAMARRVAAYLMLPREHGAWAMLLVPYILGTAAAGWPGWPSLLLIASVLLLFTASRPMELALQTHGAGAVARLAIYTALGVASGTGLLVVFGRWLLVPLAAFAGAVLAAQLLLRRRRVDRTWQVRLVSIAALSAAGPAAYYASSGAWDTRALAVWGLAFLHSGASVFHVRLYYRPPAGNRSAVEDRMLAERRMIAYVVAAIAAVAGLALVGLFPPLGVVALLPLAVKTVVACRNRASRPTLKEIGAAEVAHSALFLLLAAVAMSFW